MNIGEWPTQWAEMDPNGHCIKYGELELNKKEYNLRINRLAHALQEQGVRRGDRVSLLMANSNVFLEAVFATAKLGAILVPLNFRLVAKELEYIINNAEPFLMIYSPEFAPVVEEIKAVNTGLQMFICETDGGLEGDTNYEEWIATQPDMEPVPDSEVTLNDPHIIMYTSGTTGRPKGAVMTHGNTQWSAVNYIHGYPTDENDITACCAPFFHSGGLFSSATPSLYIGAKLVIQRMFDPVGILKIIEEEKVNSMLGIIVMFLFMSHVPQFEETDFSSLKYFVTGGSPCPKPLIETYQKKGVTFAQGYGLTEASIVTALRPDESEKMIGSCGKSLFHVKTKVVDMQGIDVPAGSVGEVLVKGPIVIPEYWRNEKATEESIINGWLHTGDIGYMDENSYLYIMDRKKDMYISGGENVYPAEVEEVIIGLEEVADVSVIGIADEKWGETGLAVVVKTPGKEISEESIIESCQGKLAKYKIPKKVDFVDQLRRTISGKVLKKDLRATYANT